MGSVSAHSPPVEGCQAPLDGVVVWVLYQLIPLLWRGVKLCLTGWLCGFCISNSPPVEGWQAKLDGVVVWVLHQQFLWRGVKLCLTGWLCGFCTSNSPPVEGCQAPLDGGGCVGSVSAHSPPVEGWQAPLDGVVVWVLYQLIPLLWGDSFLSCGAANSPPMERLIPLLWRGGKRSLTGWLCGFCISSFPSCGGVSSSA